MQPTQTFAEALAQTCADFVTVFGPTRQPEPELRHTAEVWLTGLRYLGASDVDIYMAMAHHDGQQYNTLLRLGQASGGSEFAHAVRAVRELATRDDSDPSARYSRQMIRRVVTPHLHS